jgi:hypothetical protein
MLNLPRYRLFIRGGFKLFVGSFQKIIGEFTSFSDGGREYVYDLDTTWPVIAVVVSPGKSFSGSVIQGEGSSHRHSVVSFLPRDSEFEIRGRRPYVER